MGLQLRRAQSGGERRPLGQLLADDGLIGRFGYLLASQSVLLTFGVGYWVVTAHLVLARQVGLAAAAVAVATLLSQIGIFGIGSVMLVELHRLPGEDARRVMTTGMAVGGAIVAVISTSCVLASGLLGPSMREIGSSPIDSALFVTGAVLITVTNVFDSASIGLHRARVQLYRNTLQAALRCLAVAVAVVLGMRDATALLSVWVGSVALSAAVCPMLLPDGPRTPLRERGALVRRYARLACSHHVLNLAIGSITFLLPFIAALFVQPRDLAYFSVAQLVSSSVLLPAALLAMTLFAEATDDAPALRRHIRRTIPVGFLCCGVALAVFEPLAHLVLRVFGPAYASHGTTILRLLLLGGLPYVVKDHFVSIRRAQRRLTEAAWIVAGATLVELGGAAIGAALAGLTGLCLGWIVGASIEALGFAPTVATVAYGAGAGEPATWRRLRDRFAAAPWARPVAFGVTGALIVGAVGFVAALASRGQSPTASSPPFAPSKSIVSQTMPTTTTTQASTTTTTAPRPTTTTRPRGTPARPRRHPTAVVTVSRPSRPAPISSGGHRAPVRTTTTTAPRPTTTTRPRPPRAPTRTPVAGSAPGPLGPIGPTGPGPGRTGSSAPVPSGTGGNSTTSTSTSSSTTTTTVTTTTRTAPPSSSTTTTTPRSTTTTTIPPTSTSSTTTTTTPRSTTTTTIPPTSTSSTTTTTAPRSTTTTTSTTSTTTTTTAPSGSSGPSGTSGSGSSGPSGTSGG